MAEQHYGEHSVNPFGYITETVGPSQQHHQPQPQHHGQSRHHSQPQQHGLPQHHGLAQHHGLPQHHSYPQHRGQPQHQVYQQSNVSGNAILNNNDQLQLSDFFGDPDGYTASNFLTNVGLEDMFDAKSNDQLGLNWPFAGNTINPATSLANVPSVDYSAHHTFGQPGASNGIDQFLNTNPFSNNASEDVVNGASLLSNLSSNHDQSQNHMMFNTGLGTGSWGNIGDSNPIVPVPSNLQSPLGSSGASARSRRGSANSSYTPTTRTVLTGDVTAQQQAQAMHHHPHHHQQRQQYLQDMQSTNNHRQHNSLSLDTSGMGIFPQHGMHSQLFNTPPSTFSRGNQRAFRPPPVNFGTDSAFDPRGYHPEHDVSDEQLTQRVMVFPMAMGMHSANNSGHNQGFRPEVQQRTPTLNQHRHSTSTPHSLPILSPTSVMQRQHSAFSSPGQINGQEAVEDGEDEDEELISPRPRKVRRKIRPERADDEEWSPNDEVRNGNVSRRAPRIPKPEFSDDDATTENVITAPSHRTAINRRRSTAATTENANARTSLDSRTSSDIARDPSVRTGTGAVSSKRKARDSKMRANLSENQKRANHIASEQKRRNIIKKGYEDLNNLVPILLGGKSGLSKSEILGETVSELSTLKNGSAHWELVLGLTVTDNGDSAGEGDGADEEGGLYAENDDADGGGYNSDDRGVDTFS